ncbi:MAG: hypothetical protein ACREXY_00075 [Gammaproteobacteria bacterium]
MALDSSHLFFLARAFGAGPTQPSRTHAILVALECNGERDVLSTETCVDHECFRLQGGGGRRLIDIDSGIDHAAVTSVVRVVDDAALTLLDESITVAGLEVSLDVGERTVASAVRNDSDALIVVNDEDAFDALKALVEAAHIEAIPMMSLQLARQMYECRALEFAEIEILCDQVAHDVERLANMSQAKIARKLKHAQSVISSVALEEARRGASHTQGG